ncbi:MAG: hypothetical protein COS14_00860 [Bacteroidetes bacterium CG02_land_8_20_14_3_00_31_25]|nr:hypothetical protein [Bacteroidota bacterium]PIV63138.1 MAG: hypothetical protein COS14_00860 [Bacteroidetes bacterium CG02_land_8_20_14_3_00_31_25]
MKFKNILFCLLIISLLIGGCKKAKQHKLTGSWNLLPQTAAQQSTKVLYTFASDNVLYRITNDTIVDTANYELKKDFVKYYLAITNLDEYSNANYYIEKINRKILILQCQSPYLRKEFTRHN